MIKRHQRIRQRLKDDLEHYAAKCLHVTTKAGRLEPLVFNRAQRYLHQCFEAQRKATGRVRAFVLKGRQQGCSTYVGSRFYHRTTHERGVRTFILTHDREATRTLFGMTQRFHRHCPAPLRPSTGRNSERELRFDLLDSGYRVGTAGGRGVGRSLTVRLFHGSEVAFWPNAREHAAGVLQTVPDAVGTEVVFESTANGLGNFFHAGWQAAQAGENGYQPIFIPWFWQLEYQREVPAGFALGDDEVELARLTGISNEQLAWRRAKIAELGDATLFAQEYPATPEEAFARGGEKSLIRSAHVLRARRAAVKGCGSVVAGLDPARFGDDRTSLIFRQGRHAFGLRSWQGRDTMETAGLCRQVLESDSPPVARMFVDAGGVGAGVVDRLREMGFSRRVTAVNFGGRAQRAERYRNKRAEMWGEMRDWLADEDLPVSIPDDDALHADLCAPTYGYDSSGRLVLESKDNLRARGLRSPDMADALALSFAGPVRGARPLQRFADTAHGLHRGRDDANAQPDWS